MSTFALGALVGLLASVLVFFVVVVINAIARIKSIEIKITDLSSVVFSNDTHVHQRIDDVQREFENSIRQRSMDAENSAISYTDSRIDKLLAKTTGGK